ncbi:DUF423 domain-containing protein [Pedobacter sp.]
MSSNIIIFTGGTFGILAIVLGAFGAHALKKVLSTEKLASFEVGVRYQMYNALFLLLLGFNTNVFISNVKWAFYLATIGTILFSFSIYLLALADPLKRNFKFLGPVTPIGGLLMILGWGSLLIAML